MNLTEKMAELERLHQVCMDIYKSLIEKAFWAKRPGFTLSMFNPRGKAELSIATSKLTEYFRAMSDEVKNTKDKKIFTEFYEIRLKINGLNYLLEQNLFIFSSLPTFW